GSWTGAHPHSSREYANLVGRSSSPELAAWWRGVGIEPGSTMTTRVLRRVVAPGDRADRTSGPSGGAEHQHRARPAAAVGEQRDHVPAGRARGHPAVPARG